MRAIALVTGFALTIGLSAVGPGAAPAGAMDGPAAVVLAQAQPASAGKDPARRVCRTITPSGTRLGLRSCRTQEEWDREARQYQRDAEQQRRNHEVVQPGSSTKRF